MSQLTQELAHSKGLALDLIISFRYSEWKVIEQSSETHDLMHMKYKIITEESVRILELNQVHASSSFTGFFGRD